jgi:NAD(P)-dependent dehydrogenase (short-subunit alcohol dehydrogenase family)
MSTIPSSNAAKAVVGRNTEEVLEANETPSNYRTKTAVTAIATPFGFNSTAAQVVAGIDLSGKRAIVTGASSGIGVETARALAGAGADVTLAVRDTDAGDRAAVDITATTGNAAVHVGRLDLADQASVAAFVANWSGPLHLLINNAGVMALPDLQLTREGWEMQFATNHLGHFALALGLHDALAAAGNARIVSLSSVGHRRSPVIFDDLNFTSRPYDLGLAYGQSKTANVLFAVEATRRWGSDGITANAVHPGTIATTNLLRQLDPDVLAALRASAPYAETFDPSKVRYKTIEQGAATSVLVATSPQLDGIGGRYFEDCNQASVLDPDAPNTSSSGVAAYALDPDNAKRLWDVSLRMLDSVSDCTGNR